MSDITVSSDESLVSFDVTSLFTNVPIGEVIRGKLWEDDNVIERRPLSPDRIAELLGLYLRSTYFSYGGEFDKQRDGTAMGSPLSAVVANLYMEFSRSLLSSQHPLDPVFGSCMWMTHSASLGLVMWMGSSVT